MATLKQLAQDKSIKKMDMEQARKQADRIEDVTVLSGLPRRIADAMIAVHGFYTFVRAGTNEKVFVTGVK